MHFEGWGSEGERAKRPNEHLSRARALFPGDKGSAGELRCFDGPDLRPRVARRNNGHEVVEGNGSHAEFSRLMSSFDETQVDASSAERAKDLMGVSHFKAHPDPRLSCAERREELGHEVFGNCLGGHDPG